MKSNWPENRGNVGRPRNLESKPAFTNGEQRNNFIKEHSGNRWWIQKYLEGSLPQVSK